MKKLFLLAAAALTVFAACTKNEVVPTPDQKITFSSPVVGATTKAVTGVIGTDYDASESFSVYAYYCTDDEFDADNCSLYMNSVTASYNASINDATTGTGAWEPKYTYYWPKNGKLTFSAFSPSEIKNIVTCDAATGLEIEGFTVSTNVNEQIDLLYSNRAYNKSTSEVGDNSTYDGVDIVFNHALSAIKINVSNDKQYTNQAGTTVYPITIDKIWFENVNCTANFAENLEEGYVATPDKAAWSDWSNTKNITIPVEEKVVPTTSVTQYGTTALLIPQAFTNDGNEIILHVNYTITNGDGTTIAQTAEFKLDTNNYTGSVNGGAATTIDQWTKGYQYTYNLVFGLKTIYFAPSVNVWGTVDMGTMNI